MVKPERLIVGKYLIIRIGSRQYAIQNDSGEAMSVSGDKLEKLIDDFFKRNF